RGFAPRRAASRCRCGGSGRRGVVPLDAVWSLGSARGSRIDREWSSLRASLGRGLHHVVSFPAAFVLPSSAEPTMPAQLHHRRRQKRLGGQFFGVTGIGGASRPLPEQEQERPRLSATRLRRPPLKWLRPRRRSRSPPRRRTPNRPTRGKLPASRFPTDRPSACL